MSIKIVPQGERVGNVFRKHDLAKAPPTPGEGFGERSKRIPASGAKEGR
jgi:hypothetical protein